jgi:hypothetical protein
VQHADVPIPASNLTFLEVLNSLTTAETFPNGLIFSKVNGELPGR